MSIDHTICSRCKSENLIQQTGDAEPTSHYGRLKCGDCGNHIQWLRDPFVSLLWNSRATAIDEILADHRRKVSAWEIGFLSSVREQRNLSPKQKDRLNAIGLKCLGQRICAVDDAPPVPKIKPQRLRSGS